VYSGGENDTCGWLFGTNHTCCNAPVCESKFYADKRRAQRAFKELTRRRSTGEIHELQQQELKARRRASRLRSKARKQAAAGAQAKGGAR
jgi:hypothetical protein